MPISENNSCSTQAFITVHLNICKSLNYHRPSPLFYILSPFFIPNPMTPSLNLNSLFSQLNKIHICVCLYTCIYTQRWSSLPYWHTLIAERKGTKITNFTLTYLFHKISKTYCYTYHKASFAVWLNYALTILFLSANKLLTVVISTTCHHLTKNKALKENPPGNKTKAINL